jgi:hypothetical protein
MTAAADLLIDALGRVRETVHTAVEGLDEEQLAVRLDPQANSIAWLVWHLTRVQDDHLAEVADSEQLWTREGWARRFGFPFDDSAVGYGHTSAEVAAVQARPTCCWPTTTPCTKALSPGCERSRRQTCPSRRPALGPAGDPGRSPGQRRGRLRPTRRAGSVRARCRGASGGRRHLPAVSSSAD